MIVAILASGSQSMIGLSFAVVVAVLNGIIWFGWARAIGGTLGDRSTAPRVTETDGEQSLDIDF